MPIPRDTHLAPHFQAWELGADNPAATLPIVQNLITLAEKLEQVRSILGVPLDVDSGFRTPEHNAAVGGVSTSSHLQGKAADVIPRGLSLREAYDKLQQAREDGRLSDFDQIIYYPIEGHIHVGIGDALREEFRIKLYEGKGGTPILTSELVQQLGGTVALGVAYASDKTGLPLWLVLAGAALLIVAVIVLPPYPI